jgi:hypothetical protein
MTMQLTRDDILQAQDITIEKVEVPEWGGEVFIKGLTGTERDFFESTIVLFRGKAQQMNLQDVRARLASLTICDVDGNRLFTEQNVRALGEKSAAALQRVFRIAQRLSGLSNEDVLELTEGLKQSPLEDSASG